MPTSSFRRPCASTLVIAISMLAIASAFITTNAAAAELPATLGKTGTTYKTDADMQAVLASSPHSAASRAKC